MTANLRYATVANESAQSAAHATEQADGRKAPRARTKYPIQTYIAESERERNEFMLNRYKDAQHVTLYAGSFDWICADKRLAAVVIKLAAEDKIEFISSYPSEKVSEALKEHPEVCAAVMARFRQRRGQKVVCSLISYHANHSFMYLHTGPHIERPRIFEVTDAEEGRYLLKAMGELLREEKPVVAAVPA